MCINWFMSKGNIKLLLLGSSYIFLTCLFLVLDIRCSIVGFWPLTPQYGGTDLSGNENDVVLSELSPFHAGKGSGDIDSYLFESDENSHVLIANTSDILNSSYTLMFHAFINTDVYQPYYDYASYYVDGSDGKGFQAGIGFSSDNGHLKLSFNLAQSVSVNGTYADQHAWVMYGITFHRGNQIFLFWEGTSLVDVGVLPGDFNHTQSSFQIGGSGNGIVGSLTCFQLYHKALTSEELGQAWEWCGEHANMASLSTAAAECQS